MRFIEDGKPVPGDPDAGQAAGALALRGVGTVPVLGDAVQVVGAVLSVRGPKQNKSKKMCRFLSTRNSLKSKCLT